MSVSVEQGEDTQGLGNTSIPDDDQELNNCVKWLNKHSPFLISQQSLRIFLSQNNLSLKDVDMVKLQQLRQQQSQGQGNVKIGSGIDNDYQTNKTSSLKDQGKTPSKSQQTKDGQRDGLRSPQGQFEKSQSSQLQNRNNPMQAELLRKGFTSQDTSKSGRISMNKPKRELAIANGRTQSQILPADVFKSFLKPDSDDLQRPTRNSDNPMNTTSDSSMGNYGRKSGEGGRQSQSDSNIQKMDIQKSSKEDKKAKEFQIKVKEMVDCSGEKFTPRSDENLPPKSPQSPYSAEYQETPKNRGNLSSPYTQAGMTKSPSNQSPNNIRGSKSGEEQRIKESKGQVDQHKLAEVDKSSSDQFMQDAAYQQLYQQLSENQRREFSVEDWKKQNLSLEQVWQIVEQERQKEMQNSSQMPPASSGKPKLLKVKEYGRQRVSGQGGGNQSQNMGGGLSRTISNANQKANQDQSGSGLSRTISNAKQQSTGANLFKSLSHGGKQCYVNGVNKGAVLSHVQEKLGKEQELQGQHRSNTSGIPLPSNRQYQKPSVNCSSKNLFASTGFNCYEDDETPNKGSPQDQKHNQDVNQKQKQGGFYKTSNSSLQNSDNASFSSTNSSQKDHQEHQESDGQGGSLMLNERDKTKSVSQLDNQFEKGPKVDIQQFNSCFAGGKAIIGKRDTMEDTFRIEMNLVQINVPENYFQELVPSTLKRIYVNKRHVQSKDSQKSVYETGKDSENLQQLQQHQQQQVVPMDKDSEASKSNQMQYQLEAQKSDFSQSQYNCGYSISMLWNRGRTSHQEERSRSVSRNSQNHQSAPSQPILSPLNQAQPSSQPSQERRRTSPLNSGANPDKANHHGNIINSLLNKFKNQQLRKTGSGRDFESRTPPPNQGQNMFSRRSPQHFRKSYSQNSSQINQQQQQQINSNQFGNISNQNNSNSMVGQIPQQPSAFNQPKLQDQSAKRSSNQEKEDHVIITNNDMLPRVPSKDLMKSGAYEGPIGLTRYSIEMKIQEMTTNQDGSSLTMTNVQLQQLQDRLFDQESANVFNNTLFNNTFSSSNQYNHEQMNNLNNMTIPQNFNFINEKLNFFAVFDGHGGSLAAEYCVNRLHVVLKDRIVANLKHVAYSQQSNTNRTVGKLKDLNNSSSFEVQQGKGKKQKYNSQPETQDTTMSKDQEDTQSFKDAESNQDLNSNKSPTAMEISPKFNADQSGQESDQAESYSQSRGLSRSQRKLSQQENLSQNDQQNHRKQLMRVRSQSSPNLMQSLQSSQDMSQDDQQSNLSSDVSTNCKGNKKMEYNKSFSQTERMERKTSEQLDELQVAIHRRINLLQQGSYGEEQVQFNSVSQAITAALEDSFVLTDDEFCIEEVSSALIGTTALVTLVGEHQIYVAHCGDSRGVICRNGTAYQLTDDHKADREDEMKRVEDKGGMIVFWGAHRIQGVLAMSRSIGDKCLRPYVTSVPEVVVLDRQESDEFLLLASDGLWDVISNDDACLHVKKTFQKAQARGIPPHKQSTFVDLQFVCRGTNTCTIESYERHPLKVHAAINILVSLAMQKGSRDNITIVLVDLRRHKDIPQEQLNVTLDHKNSNFQGQ